MDSGEEKIKEKKEPSSEELSASIGEIIKDADFTTVRFQIELSVHLAVSDEHEGNNRAAGRQVPQDERREASSRDQDDYQGYHPAARSH